MCGGDGFVSREVASHEVEVAMTRLALLHQSFSKTLIEGFGLEKGRELIIRSIMEYGERMVGGRSGAFRTFPSMGFAK
jgi:hypothetical protein